MVNRTADKTDKVAVIVQARMGSSRLPGKVLLPILGQPMLSVLLERISTTPGADEIVVATSDQAGDDPIEKMLQIAGISCHRGPEHDVLTRFYEAARAADAQVIVRVTADNPLYDTPTAEQLIRKVVAEGYDYAANNLTPQLSLRA